MSNAAEERLMAARCRLMATQPWYGHMSLMMEWEEAKDTLSGMRTMYVMAKSGKIYCRWYREFIEGRTVEELYGCVQHEIEHILRLHLVRHFDSIDKDSLVWNFAVDMCVNGRADSPRIGYSHDKEMILPLGPKSKDPNVGMVWIPKDWPDNETAEFYYDKLMNDAKWQKIFSDIRAGMPCCGTLDDHGQWSQSDMAPDQVRQIVSDMVKEATGRAAGNVPGHVIQMLDKLNKPILNPRELFQRFIGRHVGGKRKTYSRRNRRNDSFGIPGFSHRAATHVTAIVDTSGSVSKADLEQFFSELEAISCNCRLSVLLWDHAFQGYWKSYRKGDWKRIDVKGRGGTDMAAPVEWLIENKLVSNVCTMLTDGECNYADPKPFPMVTCICTPDGKAPSWGDVVYMKMDH